MFRRRLFLIGTLVVWLGVLVYAGKVAIDRLSVPVWGNPAGDDRSPEISESSRVGQAFTAPYTGLNRIEVVVAGGSAASSEQVTLHVSSDPEATSDLAVATFDISALHGGSPLGVDFEPVRTSKGQQFYILVESSSSAAAEGITLRYGPQSIVDGASAYQDGQPIAGNLEFRTYYSLRTRDKIDLLLARLSEGRPYFLGTKGFYIALAVAYCAVLSVFVLFVARRILGEGEGEP